MHQVEFICHEIGQSHTYQEVWDFQSHLQKRIVEDKRNGIITRPNYLLLCEHPPVYTLGKSGKMEHLKLSQDEIDNTNISFHKINRGGDITFHGPGQLTVYPIINLDHYYNDLHRYVREIEQVVINVLSHYNISGNRIKEFTGVWLDVNKPNKRKICAIGIHMSRWVSMHGFALNVNTELNYFDNIIPCGIVDPDKSVTSISQEIGTSVDLEEVRNIVKIEFIKMFPGVFI